MTAPNDESPNALLEQKSVQELIELGAREGKVSYGRINDVLRDLEIDELEAEEIFEALESRGIEIIEDEVAEPVAAKKPPKAKAAPTPKVRKGQHKDLDEVLASLEEMIAPIQNAEADKIAQEENADEEREPTDADLVAGMAADELYAEDESEDGTPGSAIVDALTQYMNQMGRVPLMTPEEELRWANLARNGSPEEQTQAKQKLVEANLRLVVHIARRYKGRAALPLLDVVQEGNIGLMRAVERFRPERGHRLGAYATWWIRQSINRAIAAQARSIRLPGHLGAAIQKLQRLQRELSQELGRQPLRAELAQAAGMSEAQVEEALRAAAEPLSLEHSANDEENTELGDLLSDPDSELPLSALSRNELRAEINPLFEGLSEREVAIVSQRFGIGEYSESGPSTAEEVATRMNLSRQRISEIETRALRKMRRRTQGTVLGQIFEEEGGL